MAIIERDDPRIVKLHAAQDEILRRLSPALADAPEIWLSGGTVLAREWLDHRISFDLDFFVPHDFPLADFQKKIRRTGFIAERKALGDDVCQQLFGKFVIDGQQIEVSFIQDRFHHLFEPVEGSILRMRVEPPEVIYQRKASIIIGLCPEYANGRSRARDIFDLLVLSRRTMSVDSFVEKIWGERALENFCEGLSRIDTLKVVNDPRIFVYPEWDHADDGIKALDIVMRDIGMTTEDVDEVWKLEPHS